jgi:hypothetical protein
MLPLPLCVAVPDIVPLPLRLALCVALSLAVGDVVRVEVAVKLGVRVPDAVFVLEPELLHVTDPVALLLRVCVAVPELEAVSELEDVKDGVPEGVTLAVRDCDAVLVPDADWLRDAVTECVPV